MNLKNYSSNRIWKYRKLLVDSTFFYSIRWTLSRSEYKTFNRLNEHLPYFLWQPHKEFVEREDVFNNLIRTFIPSDKLDMNQQNDRGKSISIISKIDDITKIMESAEFDNW